MSKERHIIDFEIIWKKIHQTLSEKEEKLLRAWQDEDPAHQQYFNQAKEFYAKGSRFANTPNELQQAWKTVQKKIGGTRQRIIHLATITSSIAASLLIVAALFYFSNKSNPLSEISENYQVMPPGSGKAILILDNGKTYNLSDKKNLVLVEGHAMIRNSGDKLEYFSQGKPGEEIKYNTLKVPRGGEFFLQLSDGTKIWLNSETSLRYPVRFTENERQVELTGEAYFEVTKDEHAPFYVSSGSQKVKVLGTRFNISSYNESPFIVTTLIEGKVEVSEKEGLTTPHILMPCEQSLFSKENKEITTRKINPATFVSWKEGRFVFEDESLSDIMLTLSRWYNVDYVFINETAKGFRFTGNLPRYANISDLLQKIGKTKEVHFNIENNTVIIE